MTSVDIRHGDCRDVLRWMQHVGETVHSVVTDPPYNLASIVKRFGAKNAAPAKSNGATGVYSRYSRGFMGQEWDNEVAFDPATWSAVLDVLEPGGHLVAFGGTRTYHRMVTAIEDAGFEIRDSLMWLYGSAMPHSKDIGKLTGDPAAEGWGTNLKPAWEPIVLARKPLAGNLAFNWTFFDTGGINVGACRVEGGKRVPATASGKRRSVGWGMGGSREGTSGMDPTIGRWPANVLHDGSPEVLAALGEAASYFRCCPWSDAELRFHYSAKANKADRAGSGHPTVKPISLMRWLARLVTPPGGRVLDPFAGSGTTGTAALREGFDAVLVEQSETYIGDIVRRLAGERAVLWPGPWGLTLADALGRHLAAVQASQAALR